MTAEATPRPRVEGAREQEILRAALDVLADVGYDRLTMDAVAHRARASKATLYRRWDGKVDLVVDALRAMKQSGEAPPDLGDLRSDLLAAYCRHGGVTDPAQLALFSSVLTALARDAEFADAYRREVLHPMIEVSLGLYERARDRGELRDDVDLGLIGPALTGVLLHRFFMLGEPPDRTAVERVLDQIILPAVLRAPDRP